MLISNAHLWTLRLWTAFVKCLPCQCLAFYLGTSGSNAQIVKWSFYAMIFSVGGDFCLVFPDHFITGILLFAVAQVCFIRGFGFKPLRWDIKYKYWNQSVFFYFMVCNCFFWIFDLKIWFFCFLAEYLLTLDLFHQNFIIF